MDWRPDACRRDPGTADPQRPQDHYEGAFPEKGEGEHDLDGRLESRIRGASETWSYHYDFRGNLINVETPSNDLIEYIVDGQNRRVARKVNGARTNGYIYRESQLIAELDENNDVRSQFIYGALGQVPIAMRRDGTWYGFVVDPRGSVRLVIDTSTGRVEQAIEYDSFGRVVLDTNPGFQPFGFAGGIFDSATGLVRFGARDYDPLVGRWTAKDPILFNGRDTNLYGYVGNDPINFIDPSGEIPLVVGAAIILGAGLAINYFVVTPIIEARIARHLEERGALRLPRDPDTGEPTHWRLPGNHSVARDRDAFKHCMASCNITRRTNRWVAKVAGDCNERWSRNPPSEAAADQRNNRDGRELGLNADDRRDCISSCVDAVSSGVLNSTEN